MTGPRFREARVHEVYSAKCGQLCILKTVAHTIHANVPSNWIRCRQAVGGSPGAATAFAGRLQPERSRQCHSCECAGKLTPLPLVDFAA